MKRLALVNCPPKVRPQRTVKTYAAFQKSVTMDDLMSILYLLILFLFFVASIRECTYTQDERIDHDEDSDVPRGRAIETDFDKLTSL